MPSSTDTSARAFFARCLRELRVRKGFKTARSLALALGIDENRYTRYERAEVEPDIGLLVKICKTLGVTPNDLLLEPATQPAKPAAPNGVAYGFAETAAESSAPRDPPPDSATLKRRAVAWEMARILAHSDDGASGDVAPGTGRELGAVARTSRIFTSIERDPFGFVANIGPSPRLAALPPDQQRRLSSLFEELLAAYNPSGSARPGAT